MNIQKPLSLVTPAEYVQQRPFFESMESWRWFERSNRTELVRTGALLMPTGRKLVDPAAFDLVVVEVGKRRAAKAQG